MLPRRILLVGVVALAVAGGVWGLTVSHRGQGTAPVAPDDVPSEEVDRIGRRGRDPADRTDVELPPSGDTLVGCAVHHDGSPFHGWVGARARLLPAGSDPHGPGPGDVETSTDGRFRISGLAAGAMHLWATSPQGLVVRGPTVRVPNAEDVRFVVDLGPRPVTVRVTQAGTGRPIPGATVAAWFPDVPARRLVRTRSDRAGAAVLHVPPREGYVHVRAAGYLAAGTKLTASATLAEIDLVRRGRVQGRVVTAGSGEPVTGVKVFAVLGSGPSLDLENDRTATTTADGRYEIDDLRPGLWTVFVLDDEWISPQVSEVGPRVSFNPLATQVGPAEVVTRDLAVTPTRRIRGKVVDSGGAPITGARVYADTRTGRRSWSGFDARRPVAVSDSAGAFVLGGMLPGNFSLRAESDRHLTGTPGDYISFDTDDVVLTLRDAWFARVVVRDEGGAPVPGATVTVHLDQGHIHFQLGSWEADRLGVATAGPLPGRPTRVTVTAPGFLERSAAVAEGVAEDRPTTDVEFVLRRGKEISGTVILPDGAGPLTFLSVRSVTDPLAQGPPNYATAEVGSNLAFVLRGLPPTGHVVTALASDGEGDLVGSVTTAAGAVGVVVPLARKVEEDRRPERVVTGEVSGPEGRPVPRASVTIAWEDHRLDHPWVWSEGDVRTGRFDVEIPDDVSEYWVRISKAADSTGHLLPLGQVAVGPFDPVETRSVEVRLAPQARLRGRVLDETGRGVQGFAVRVDPAQARFGDSSNDGQEAVWTAADGSFGVPRLSRGSYELRFSSRKGYVDLPSRIVSTGSDDVEIRSVVETTVTVTVLFGDGEPLYYAEVRVDDRAVRSVYTDRSGRASLVGVILGARYRLQVNTELADAPVSDLVLENWVAAAETLVVPPGYTRDGVVQDMQGRALGGARVWVRDRGSMSSRTADEEGRFRFEHLPSPDARLAAALSWRDHARGAEATVLDDRSTPGHVVLVLDPGHALRLRTPTPTRSWWKRLRARVIDQVSGDVREQGLAFTNGFVYVADLDPDHLYTLWISGHQGDNTYLTDLRPGPQIITAEPNSRGVVTGRLLVDGHPITFPVDVRVNFGVVQVRGAARGDGRYVVRGLPEGTWTVRAHYEKDGVLWSGRATAATGSPADVELSQE